MGQQLQIGYLLDMFCARASVGLRMAAPLRSFSSSAARMNSKTLTWNDFFALRARRRKLGQFCSVGTTLVGLGAAWSYFANIEIDITQKLFGVDAIFVYGTCIVLAGVVGYLAGPSVGNLIFRSTLGKRAQEFMRKDSVFLQHIKTNRPDPSKQSYTNPITDYYGEKIDSLSGYRRWLRDAHIYKRKSETYL